MPSHADAMNLVTLPLATPVQLPPYVASKTLMAIAGFFSSAVTLHTAEKRIMKATDPRAHGAAPTPTWLMNCCVPCHGGFGGSSDEPGTSQASVRWTNYERREARKRNDRRSLAIG